MSTDTDIRSPTRVLELERLLSSSHPLAVFLDLDGTLVDIAPKPDAIVVPARLIDILENAATTLDGALALVTGRPLADIDRHLHPLVLPAAGEHGNACRTGSGGVEWLAPEMREEANRLYDILQASQPVDDGTMLERKPSAIAIHYRLAPHKQNECIARMKAAAGGNPAWKIVPGKMVIEARASGIDKGKAVEWFMHRPPFKGRTPVFIGDDTTDEDGIRAVQVLGGFGIKVGEGASDARLRVPGISAVHDLLERLHTINSGNEAFS